MEIALMIEGQDGLNWSRWKRIVRQAEELGFHGLYRSDHATTPVPARMDSLDLWVSLVWQADHTQRMALGSLVSPVSFRHPAHTVRMASAVDDLSGGRLVLGLGAGWQEREHRMFGWPLLDVDSRFARFDEALEIIFRMLRSDAPVTFHGQYYELEEAIVLPRPSRPGGPPILIGGNGPRRTLPLAAIYADEWNAHWINPAQFQELNQRLDELLDAGRRPRDSCRRSLLQAIVFGADEARLMAKLRRRGQSADSMRERGVLYGPPFMVQQQVAAYEAAGVQQLVLEWVDLDDAEGLEALAAAILPRRLHTETSKADHVPLSGIRRAFDQGSHMQDVITLALGEPDFDTPEPIKAAARAAIDEGYNHYTPTAGLPETRAAVARKLARDTGHRYDPASEIIMTGGAINALSLALFSILSPGDEVLVTDPGYTVFGPCVRMADGVPVMVPLSPDNGFRVQAKDLEAATTARTRAILLNSPHNPTGSVLARADLEPIAALARDRDLMVLSDEVYEKFIYTGQPHVSIASLSDMRTRTIILNSFSKTCCICGWRIGFAAAPPHVVERMVRVQQLQVVSASSVAQRALLAALDEQPWLPDMVAEYDRRRRYLVEQLNTMPGVSCTLPDGAFYVFANVSQLGSSERVAARLASEARIMAVPGIAFGRHGEGYLRMAFARPMPMLEEAVKRIAATLTGTGK